MLTKISQDELIFSGSTEDFRTNTYLSLDDYDWMNYMLETRFVTEKLGRLDVKFTYWGAIHANMVVDQVLDERNTLHVYRYSAKLFAQYLKQYMTKHMEQWGTDYVFYGGDIVLDFYNAVIEQGILMPNRSKRGGLNDQYGNV